MNVPAVRQQMPSQGFRPQSEAEALSAELAKMLGLVAPSSMTTDQQTLWLASAIDALDGIRAAEVESVSAQVRRSIKRHNDIVPEIAKLVAEKRKHPPSKAGGWTAMDYVRRAREDGNVRCEASWLAEAKRLGEIPDYSGDRD